jgi:hypothetical protein
VAVARAREGALELGALGLALGQGQDGFFLSSNGENREEPNELYVLVQAGAVTLAAGLVSRVGRASKTCTSQPLPCRVRAVARPAGPAPMMASRRRSSTVLTS